MPQARTAERLRRLLAVVPYVVAHPGAPIEELTRLFGVEESDLTTDLNVLFMTGVPPYQPGDLVDVELEEGRVWIRMADHLARPMRLTRPEAVSLFLRGSALLGTPGLEHADALRSALGKLEEALGPEAVGELRVEVEAGAPPGPVEEMRRASTELETVEIDYYSHVRDEMSTRQIDPEQVFGAIGHWYAVAWDHRSGEERLFRLDRIRDVRGTGEHFERRGLLGQGRPLYTPSGDEVEVRLLLRPPARWVAEYYEVRGERERDGLLEVGLPTKDLAWVAKLLLRLGGSADVIEPAELVGLVRDLAGSTLARYR